MFTKVDAKSPFKDFFVINFWTISFARQAEVFH